MKLNFTGGAILSDNISAFNAAEYDEKIKKTLPYYEEFYAQVADIINVKFHKPIKWFDIGCGTGKMEEIAFSNCNIEKLVACDVSEKMVNITKNRFKNKNMQSIVAPISDLKLDEQFDVITAIQVFHYLQKQERIEAVKKCFERLNSQGVFMTFENFAANSEVGKKLFLERWKAFQIAQGKGIDESNAHISRYGKAYFPITILEHLQVLNQCGFTNAEVFWVSNMQVGLLGIKA